MWTGDGRVFFYNPSSRTSVWERPEDLVGRGDVDKMVGNPPENVLQSQAALNAGSNGVSVSENSVSVAIKRENKPEEEQPIPAKKIKKEEPPVKGWSYPTNLLLLMLCKSPLTPYSCLCRNQRRNEASREETDRGREGGSHGS